jgi:hypothetical protein
MATVVLGLQAPEQAKVAPYGPNGKVLENAARDTQQMTKVWNKSWQELIGLLDEMGQNHTSRKHWIGEWQKFPCLPSSSAPLRPAPLLSVEQNDRTRCTNAPCVPAIG